MRGTFGAACAAAERLEPRCLLAAAVTPLGAAGVTPLSTAVSLGGAHYFLAGRSAGGAELWRTDGTAAGTSLVAAVPEPLQASYAFDAWAGRPPEIAVAGGAMFFAGRRQTGGAELWRSDGTPGGTGPVPGARGGAFREANVSQPKLAVLNDRVYFLGGQDGVGPGVWSVDPSPGGAVTPLRNFPVEQGPHNLQSAGGALFFGTRDTVAVPGDLRGVAFAWQSDGTASGTRLVQPLGSGYASEPPLLMEAVAGPGGTYLRTIKGDLWGPGRDADEPLAGGIWIQSPTAVGGRVVFASSSPGIDDVTRLYRTDGTADGTGPYYEVGSRAYDVWSRGYDVPGTGGFVRRGGTLFFFYANGLWRTDGTAEGTSLVRQFYPDVSPHPHWGPQLSDAGGTLVFAADDGVHGTELWRSDGTAAGTAMVADLTPGDADTSLKILGADDAGGVLFGATVPGAGGGAEPSLMRFDPAGGTPDPLNGAPLASASVTIVPGGGAAGEFGPEDTLLRLDAGASTDPDGDALSYEWDLDEDGAYDDATGAVVELTWGRLQLLGVQSVDYAGFRVRVGDGRGASADASLTVLVRRPDARLVAPRVADVLSEMPVVVADDSGTGFNVRLMFNAFEAMDDASFGGDDVVVVGPDGVGRPAAFVALESNTGDPSGSRWDSGPTATYRFAAPGGTADVADLGTYTVRLAAGAVVDRDGNTHRAAEFAARAMLERNAPTARLAGPPVEPDEYYLFTVTYADDTALDPATVEGAGLEIKRVAGSGAGEQFADAGVDVYFLSKAQAPDGSWVATYRAQEQRVSTGYDHIAFADGTYAVFGRRRVGVVTDVSGNILPDGEVGRFTVTVPRGGPDVWVDDVVGSITKRAGPGGRGRVNFSLAGVVRNEFRDVLAGVAAPPVDVAVFLTGPFPAPGNVPLATLRGQTPGVPGSPKRLRMSFKIPSTLAAGGYGVVVLADSPRALAETHEGNNRGVLDGFQVPEQYVSLRIRPQSPARQPRRGGVVSLVLSLENVGSVPARGTATVAVVLTALGADGTPVAGVEPVRAQTTVRLNLRPLAGERPRGRATVRFRIPPDWPAGPAAVDVALEPDANLAALDRDGVRSARLSLDVQ